MEGPDGAKQHFLYFFPLPQGHGSFLPAGFMGRLLFALYKIN
jgi:hypothetical protein